MSALDTLRNWITASALPLWTDRGFNIAAGRFRERLDQNGDPLLVPHRAMVQARQIFVFAHAASAGWTQDGGTLAEVAMASLMRDFAQDDGDETAFAFAIDPASGTVQSPVRDTYAHAFILFAIAALYRLNGDGKLLDIADRTIRFVERSLTDPVHGGLFDALPAPAGKRQNPHMHLLEAYLFLERAAPGRGYIARARSLVALFKTRFFHDGLLFEHFDRDWTLADGGAWEPGHHFEWVWLLDEYSAQTVEDMGAWRDALYVSATRHGIAQDNLIVDELSADGAIARSSHRLWPHCEAIKAAAARHMHGDASARDVAEAMAKALLDTFLDRPFAGGWTDHLSREGAPLVDYVPASSLYHLVLAASAAEQVFGRGFPAAPALAKASA